MHAVRQHRHQARQRMSLPAIIMIMLLFSVCIYIYFSKLKEIFRNDSTEERCLSELASVKYQLDTVSGYKTKIDMMLSDVQQDCKLTKDTLKELSNNYVLLRGHLDVCEMQTEELQQECNRLQAKLTIADKKLEDCAKPTG